jgi:hypothetical protein
MEAVTQQASFFVWVLSKLSFPVLQANWERYLHGLSDQIREMKNLLIFVLFVSLLVIPEAKLSSHQDEFLSISKAPSMLATSDCTYKGIALHGKVQFVESFPDLKIQLVERFPDIKVKLVESFPDDCGEWQVVESFPDFKVQVVESFPDLKVQYVESFPGMEH